MMSAVVAILILNRFSEIVRLLGRYSQVRTLHGLIELDGNGRVCGLCPCQSVKDPGTIFWCVNFILTQFMLLQYLSYHIYSIRTTVNYLRRQ